MKYIFLIKTTFPLVLLWRVIVQVESGARWHSSIFLSSSTKENITTREKKTTATAATENGYKFGEAGKKLLHSSSAAPDDKYVSPASTASLWDFYHKENGAIVWWDNIHNTMQNVHIVIEHAVHIVIELPTGHNTQYSNALYSQHLLWTLRSFREWMKILFENVPWDFSLYIHKTTEKCLRSYS